MSTLRVTSITTPSGGQPTIDGLAKAWVNFNGTGTVAIRASLNVSSITDNATGDYTVNFTTAFADADYAVVLSAGTSGGNSRFVNPARTVPTTSAARVLTQDGAFSGFDSDYNYVAVFR
jgi:hypothetical protein